MKKDSKQRLFEVMGKVDKTFKPKLNEDFGGIPPEYQIEFDNLKKEYGDNVINSFFTHGLPGFYDSRTRGNYSLDAIKQNLNHVSDEYLPITTPIGSEDDKLFVSIVNQGIDSHLEGFRKSKFSDTAGTLGRRRVFNFHKSEIPILLRRLEELGTEEALQWKDDIENYDKNINEVLQQNEELAVASDGGYYDKPEHQVVVSREEAQNIKQITDSMFNELFSGEGVTKVDVNDNLKQEIINKLKESGIKIDYDDEEGQYFYWMSKDEDLELAKDEFKLIVSNLYNKVQNEPLSEAKAINPKYSHFAVTKAGKIVNGWDYSGMDPEELKSFKKDYFFNDIVEMGIDPKTVAIYTTRTLQKRGINPFDSNNWN